VFRVGDILGGDHTAVSSRTRQRAFRGHAAAE